MAKDKCLKKRIRLLKGKIVYNVEHGLPFKKVLKLLEQEETKMRRYG